MLVLVTGNAGFIGFHTVRRLLERGDSVVGIDVVNDYYDPALKQARLKVLDEIAARSRGSYRFIRADLAERRTLESCFTDHRFDRVIHLAAQAGVRYSLENPRAYVESNIVAFTHLLEACREARAPHLVYASTSSVYGANTKMPFSEHDGVNHPVQFYAATKRANELMAHSYSHLFQLPTTGLRFFTVYGPWGRPDMAPYLFTKNIFAGEPIKLFNNGEHMRDFTYIDDIVDGILRTSEDIARPNPDWDGGTSGPGNQQRAISHLQYRQQQAGHAVGFHRGDRGRLEQEGRPGIAADAARRCAEHLRRRQSDCFRRWLSAASSGAGRRCPPRTMVSRIYRLMILTGLESRR